MTDRIRKLLDRPVDEIKEDVLAEDHALDEVISVEQEQDGREELVAWLQQRQLINDDDLVESLLAHVEYAYRTAAISEETYQQVKQLNRELLEE